MWAIIVAVGWLPAVLIALFSGDAGAIAAAIMDYYDMRWRRAPAR